MLFHGIAKALQKGERVCIATPRTDVVLELVPRLQKVFPNVNVASLYRGSEDRDKDAALVVATTHQLLRYYRAFQVLLLFRLVGNGNMNVVLIRQSYWQLVCLSKFLIPH